MRAHLFVASLAIAAMPNRATAVEYPWCVHYSMQGDVSNCGFMSYEQCRMTATPGAGGFCQRNPFYVASQTAERPRAKKKRPNP